MGLIRPPIEQGGDDLLLYQTKIDESLTTTDKTIVGSINEANKQLIQIEGKDSEQDSRLKNVEYKNKVQQVYLDGLFGNSADDVLSIEGEGDNLKLEGSKVGYVEVEKLVGNTLVNLSNQKDKVTITKKYDNIVGNEGKLVVGDVVNKKGHVIIDKIVGNTLVNLKGKQVNYFPSGSGDNIILTANDNITCYEYEIEPNTTYTLEKFTESDRGNVACFESNNIGSKATQTIMGLISQTNTIATITTGANDKYLYTYVATTLLSNEVELNVLKGDYTNKPIPNDFIEGLQSSFEDNYIPTNLSNKTIKGSAVSYATDTKTFTTNLAENRACICVDNVKASTTYTVISYNDLISTGNYYEGQSNNVIQGVTITDIGNGVYKLTTSGGCLSLGLNFKYSDDSTVNLSDAKVVVLEGDYTSNTPSYEEVTNKSGKYKVPIKINNKNLFNNANLLMDGVNKILYDSKNCITFTQTLNRKDIIRNTGQFKSNTQYTLQYKVYYENSEPKRGQVIQIAYTDGTLQTPNNNGIYNKWTTITLTSLPNKTISSIQYTYGFKVDEVTTYIDVDSVQIEEGTVATDYEEYFERTANVYLNSPLLKGDEIVIHNGELCHYHKGHKVTLKGGESWSVGTTNGGWTEFDDTLIFFATFGRYDDIKYEDDISLYSEFICDKLPYIPNLVNINKIGISNQAWGIKGHISIRINKTDLVSEDEYGFTQWLQSNNLVVVYTLKEPYYEVIDTEDLTLECANNSTIHIDTVVPIENISFKTHEEELRYLYNSKTYKVKFTSDAVGNCDITLGGTQSLNQSVKVGINEFYITTPSTLTDNKLIISGEGFSIEEVSVIDTVLDYDYFEGISSCFENQLVTEQMVTDGLEDRKNLGKYKTSIKIVGKNLLPYLVQGYISSINGMFEPNIETAVRSDYIKVDNSKQYYISGLDNNYSSFVSFYDKDKNWIGRTSGRKRSILTITNNPMNQKGELIENYKYIAITQYGLDIPNTEFIASTSIQLEEGSVATTYEPYFEHVENIYLNSPLLKEGELVWEDGELRHYHRYGKVILDHNKEWIDNNNNSTGCYALSLANKPSIDCKTDSNLIISDVLKWRNGDVWDSFGDNEISVTSDNGTIYIFTKIVTLEEFKTWLQSNPITIVYKLAEPYYEVIQTSKLMPKCSNDSTLHIDTIIPIKYIKASYTGNIVSMNTIRATKETTDYNSLDINDLIIPYCLDLDAQISEINVSLEAITPQTQSLKIKSIFGGIDMTYQVLKREIIRGVMTYEDCIDKIAIFKLDNKLTEAQAEELTELAEIYLK